MSAEQKMREALLKCKTCALPTEVRDLVIAALAEHPAQGEPIGAVHTSGDVCRWMPHFAHPMYAADFRPLYAAPPAPSVPDEIEGDTDWNDDFDQGYREGWNACRAAILAASPEVPRG